MQFPQDRPLQDESATTGTVPNVAPPPVTPDEPSPRLIARATVALVVLGVAHRAAVFALHFDDVRRFVTNNPILTWQFPPVPALSHHLAKSLLFLQQTP